MDISTIDYLKLTKQEKLKLNLKLSQQINKKVSYSTFWDIIAYQRMGILGSKINNDL